MFMFMCSFEFMLAFALALAGLAVGLGELVTIVFVFVLVFVVVVHDIHKTVDPISSKTRTIRCMFPPVIQKLTVVNREAESTISNRRCRFSIGTGRLAVGYEQ